MTGEVPSSLTALADALIPGTGPGEPGPVLPPAHALGVDRDVAELVRTLPAAQRQEFDQLLRAVENPFLNLILGGNPRRFTRRDAAAQERYLLGMARSRLAIKRRGFQAIKRLVGWSYFTSPPSGPNPIWSAIGYGPRPILPAPTTPAYQLPVVTIDRDTTITADVCVVGSGAGGSVVAARAGLAGRNVVVLEAGERFPPAMFPRTEREGFDRLYVGHGLVTTRDSAIAILAGEGAGGGTSINWMTCLPPIRAARLEWQGATGFGGPDDARFDSALRAATDRLRVSTAESTVNAANDVLLRGSVALGYREGTDWQRIPRNAVGCASRCGFCGFGCPYDARQSAVNTYLREATDHGARLYASMRAELIEIEGGRVRGVRARSSREGQPRILTVRAPQVVLAAGALQTPPLLLRSGVRHAGVGAGLRLDPTTALAAELPFPVRTWEGPPQTIAVRRFQETDEGAHGPWIESAPAHPGLSALALPWAGAAAYVDRLRRLERTATPIVLVRDCGEGRVTADPEGRPVIDYRLTSRDRAHLVHGLVEVARIATAAGATRLGSLHSPPIEVGDGTRPVSTSELDRFVAEVERAGIHEHSVGLFSAHPMGSARAGTDPRSSAADTSGRVHGVEGLWIADGSLLPSAPGANPMLSILAWAGWVASALLAAGAPSS